MKLMMKMMKPQKLKEAKMNQMNNMYQESYVYYYYNVGEYYKLLYECEYGDDDDDDKGVEVREGGEEDKGTIRV
ncbi:MAG: hypothetical protein EZS28_014456 [Streblomastix strix]|uniref:Uncharacterized protein n=1 Tax=Streblomastix strix TaxID=222440 RepID=A0A5J4W567_9EUKA|nr:MAG: hypothetical protein EZS28_014456 [Streblomastix strix]